MVFTSGADQTTLNQAVFETYVSNTTDAEATILNKTRGVDHGGLLQFASTAQEYQDLETFLGLVGSSGGGAQNQKSIF